MVFPLFWNAVFSCYRLWQLLTILDCFPPSADNLGPVVVYCPPDRHITATEMNTLVTWNEPQFQDNSNDPLLIDCNYRSGTEFYWGTYAVTCRAYDNNPNNDPAVCQFKIVVKRMS